VWFGPERLLWNAGSMNVRLLVSASQLRNKLDEAITQGKNLMENDGREDLAVLSAGYQTWDRRNQLILDSSFDVKGFFTSGPKTDYLDFRGLNYAFGLDSSESITVEGIRGDVSTKMGRLSELKENLALYALEPEIQAKGASVPDTLGSKPSTVFVIHGRADTPRLEVQNLILRATSHPPVVLMDQPNQGGTIIEKLEEHLGTTAGFAVVIITGDDEGRLVNTSELQPRARQNVILELGYAMGRIGRRNVTILYEENVELPSDISGVAYYPLDTHGGWQRRLLGDLKAAGFDVNAEALLG
jgi:predicted nucleotide-binding protein